MGVYIYKTKITIVGWALARPMPLTFHALLGEEVLGTAITLRNQSRDHEGADISAPVSYPRPHGCDSDLKLAAPILAERVAKPIYSID